MLWRCRKMPIPACRNRITANGRCITHQSQATHGLVGVGLSVRRPGRRSLQAGRDARRRQNRTQDECVTHTTRRRTYSKRFARNAGTAAIGVGGSARRTVGSGVCAGPTPGHTADIDCGRRSGPFLAPPRCCHDVRRAGSLPSRQRCGTEAIGRRRGHAFAHSPVQMNRTPRSLKGCAPSTGRGGAITRALRSAPQPRMSCRRIRSAEQARGLAADSAPGVRVFLTKGHRAGSVRRRSTHRARAPHVERPNGLHRIVGQVTRDWRLGRQVGTKFRSRGGALCVAHRESRALRSHDTQASDRLGLRGIRWPDAAQSDLAARVRQQDQNRSSSGSWHCIAPDSMSDTCLDFVWVQ